MCLTMVFGTCMHAQHIRTRALYPSWSETGVLLCVHGTTAVWVGVKDRLAMQLGPGRHAPQAPAQIEPLGIALQTYL